MGYEENKIEGRNAVLEAFRSGKTIDKLLKEYPNTLLEASGVFVGLPEGQMGNSEVGHMTIGGGKVIYQSLEYINQKIKTSLIWEPLLNLCFAAYKIKCVYFFKKYRVTCYLD